MNITALILLIIFALYARSIARSASMIAKSYALWEKSFTSGSEEKKNE